MTRTGPKCLERIRRTSEPVAQLVCFHYAGGGVSAFRGWSERFPPEVELVLVRCPGRENRFRERPMLAMTDLVAELVDVLGTEVRAPSVFFGHSMGARVAFALTHELRRRGETGPAEIVVSGTPAPTVTRWKHAHHLPRPELIEHLVELGGMPEEILANTQLLDLMLPVIRADLQLSETSPLDYPDALTIPMTALAGERDAVAPPEKVRPWGAETTGPYEFVVLPGDHFFLHTEVDRTVAHVQRRIDALLAPPAAAAGAARP